MTEKFVLSIDQGTTGTKVVLLDRKARPRASSYQMHTQHYPKPGWAEHDPLEIWACIQRGVEHVLEDGGIAASQIEAIGIANQGETVMAWDEAGDPLYPAIVWSCRRSQAIAERWLADEDWGVKVSHATGLRIDPYFSATKIRWMMDEVEAVRRAVQEERIRFSTLDAWLIWKMTGGRTYATDPSTAARTLLYHIGESKWDSEILGYLGIREEWLPRLVPTMGDFGVSSGAALCGIEAPIRVSLVDQPAAMYGHLCLEPGMSKCTFGTGCFVYMNIGTALPQHRSDAMLSTVAWAKGGRSVYALDGAVYAAGAAIEWAKNELQLFDSIEQLQGWSYEWQREILDNSGSRMDANESRLWFVPSLSGIGAPLWNSNFRGMFLGLSHGAAKKDMAKAVLEGIAHRVADVLEAMQAESGYPVTVLRVDGGLTNNAYLMQFQADLLGIPIEVSSETETTAMGTGYMTGEACGWWTTEELRKSAQEPRAYEPRLDSSGRARLRGEWSKLIRLLADFYSK